MPASRWLPGWLVLLLVALLCIRLAATRPAQARPAQPSSCAAITDAGGQLLLDLPGLAGGPAELCLLNYADENVADGIVLNAGDVAGFEAAKADAIAQVQALGQDLCQIVFWDAPGLVLPVDDHTQLPLSCPPRIVAGDAGAAALLTQVTAAFGQVSPAIASQLNWQPDRPLIVKVYTDLPTLIAVYQQVLPALLPKQSLDALAQTARDGVSWYLSNGEGHLGNAMWLNLTQGGRARTIERITYHAAYLEAAFAATAVGTTSQNFDYWFRQGLNEYLAERNSGSATGSLALAAKDQASGNDTPLPQVATVSDWVTASLRQGYDADLTARAYAAIVYLSEQYGFPAVAGLNAGNHNGSLAQFEAQFQQLTGVDMQSFDQVLGAWLLTLPSAALGRTSNGVTVQLTLSPGGSFGEATVTFGKALPCGAGKTIAAGTVATFTVSGGAGSYQGSGYVANATITLNATVSGTTVSGLVSYNDPSGCSVGPLAVGG